MIVSIITIATAQPRLRPFICSGTKSHGLCGIGFLPVFSIGGKKIDIWNDLGSSFYGEIEWIVMEIVSYQEVVKINIMHGPRLIAEGN